MEGFSLVGKRLHEPDILRAVAILLIILFHVRGYINQGTIIDNILDFENAYLAQLGVGLFVFISGFLLYHNHPNIINLNDSIEFFKKRVFRIYPLYWAAIIATLFLYGCLHLYFYRPIDFSLENLIINFVGLQLFTGSEYLTYWFIGTILIFYIFYPIIVGLSNKTRDIVIISIFISAIMFLLINLTRSMENRFSLYFLVFVAGIVASKTGILERGKLDKYVPMLCVLIIFTFSIGNLFFNKGEYTVHSFSIINAISILVFLVAQNTLIVSFSLLLFWIVGKYLSAKWSKRLFFPQISYGSYASYLFEPMCFASVFTVAQYLKIDGYMHDFTILFVGIPLIIFVGYSAQKLENIVRQYVNRRFGNKYEKNQSMIPSINSIK